MSHGLSENLIWVAQVTFIIISNVENYICVLSIQARVKAIAEKHKPQDILLFLINMGPILHVPNE